MRNSWFFFLDIDGGPPCVLPTEPFMSNGFGCQLFSHFHVAGSTAFQEAFSCISKFAGALLVWFSSSNLAREISSSQCGSEPGSYRSSANAKHVASKPSNFSGFPVMFKKISNFNVQDLFKESERLHSFSVLSLAAALIPPFENLSPNVLALPVENTGLQIHEIMDPTPCQVDRRECGVLCSNGLNFARHTVEPRTGIEFPTILDDVINGQMASRLASEVLVGTGSRTMRIIKIKSLKIYAFGFYVHPYSLCKNLGPKYGSIPPSELNKREDFYRDLLREDIGMSLRLVVNYNGLRINTVRDAFEKSLRARLVKTNPNTDYSCLKAFGSIFTQDIPIPAGTVIHIRRTADGQLITEIGGNKIGAVKSKDLCRAFFDMYIGDVPVSEQTKQEIGANVAGLMKRC